MTEDERLAHVTPLFTPKPPAPPSDFWPMLIFWMVAMAISAAALFVFVKFVRWAWEF